MAIDKRFHELIAHLWRGGKAGYLWTPDDGNGQKLSWWLTLPLADDFSVPKLFLDRDAYFGVNPSAIRRSEHERARALDGDITVINGFYFDLDYDNEQERQEALARIKASPIQPACLVNSGGGLHGYVLLRAMHQLPTQADKDRATALQRAMVRFFGGDDGAKDLARVLRIPGTTNHKPEYAPDFPTVTIEQWDMSLLYDLSEIEPHLQPIVDQEAARQASRQASNQAHTSGASTVSLSDQQLLDVLFRSRNGAMYERLFNGDLSDANGDHSRADQLLCNGLAWLTGRDINRMDRLFRQSGLMRDKWNRDSYRESTLQNAVDSARTVYDPGYVDPQAAQAAHAFAAAGGSGGSGSQPPPNNTGGGGHGQQPGGGNIDQFLLSQGPNDEGNAQSVNALYGHQFVYCDAYGWLHYNGRFWEADGAEAALKRAIVHTLQRRAILGLTHGQDTLLKAAKPNANNVRSCLYLFESLVTVSVERFDADPELLNCNNGVINLKTGQLTPHSPTQRFTYCVPVDYDPTADYVPWIEFLSRVVSHPEMIDYLQMAVGYTATGHTREECLFYIHGPSRSGKGTFAETLLSLLPKPLGVQADFSTFTAERKGDMQNFDLAPLKPARFVVASESNKYDTLNEAKIKTATGGDWIRCAFKHRDHFEYRPQFKIWLVSNHPVKGDVDDDAFWGRVKVIEFPNSFLGKEDKTLKQRMKDPATLRGVLRWMVDGAIAWFAAPNGLNPPQAVIDATAARRDDLDYIQQWLDECCKVDPTAWTSNHDLRTSYESWCGTEGVAKKGAEQFSRALARKGFNVGVRNYTPLGKRTRGVQGLSII